MIGWFFIALKKSYSYVSNLTSLLCIMCLNVYFFVGFSIISCILEPCVLLEVDLEPLGVISSTQSFKGCEMTDFPLEDGTTMFAQR